MLSDCDGGEGQDALGLQPKRRRHREERAGDGLWAVVVAEGGGEFLYHANNEQKLTKTTLDGTIVWQVDGNFGQNASDAYRPTWFAAPPGGSELAYLCDGYGSNKVYVFNRTDGRYTGRSYGGAGGRDSRRDECACVHADGLATGPALGGE